MTSEGTFHRPVMAREVNRLLAEGGAGLLLDATVGEGGHALAFLTEHPSARVVGLDRDPEMVSRARRRLAPYEGRVTLRDGSFADLDAVLDSLGLATVDAALFDLGANSAQLDEAARGFSFLSPGPLDMRFDRSAGATAADLVNTLREGELADVLFELGDESNARRIAAAIVAERPIRDTLRLAEIVSRASPRRGRAHPATKTFQALRIAVNGEFREIERGLPAAFRRLRTGGRLLAISFHSGEDRLVKRLLKAEGSARSLQKTPLTPEADEVRANPRARTAKLRAYVKEAA